MTEELTEIELLTGVAGDRGDLVQGSPGDRLTVPEDVAAVWADGRRARRVSPTNARVAARSVETAVLGPPETAAAQRPPKR